MATTPKQQSLLFPMRTAPAQAFQEFHANNPNVYTALVRMARKQAARGKRVGIDLLWGKLRWEMTVEVDSPDGFKLNNNHRAHYARLIMEQEADLCGYFDTRALRT